MGFIHKINTKMVLMTTAVMCIGFAMSILLIEQKINKAMIGKERASSTVIAGFVAQRVVSAFKFRRQDKVDEEFKALANQKGDILQYAGVFDTEGKLFASYNPQSTREQKFKDSLERYAQQLKKGEVQIESHADYLLLMVPLLNEKDNVWLATMVIRWSLESILDQIHELVISMMTVAMTMLALIIISLVLCLRYLVLEPINRISHLAKELGEGEGDLRRRIKYHNDDELKELCNRINQFISKVHKAIVDVNEQSNGLIDIADESRAASTASNNAAQDQRRRLEQMAAAITEMSVSIRNVANNATDGETITADARRVANEVQHIVESNRDSIGAVAAEVERATTVIERVSDSSQQIGRILDVIRGIAEQTNLLALNAAIEAARAGEQGRGFAVVADEVRSLANKTQQSTEEIKLMIERLQDGSRDAANAMSQSRDKARVGVEQASQTSGALQSIHTAVEQITNIISEIARTTQDQSQTADSLSQDVVQLSELGQDSAGSAERADHASRELSDLINKTLVTLRRFKT